MLANKLCRTEKIIEYDKAIREFLNLEVAELVMESDIKLDRAYYLPHKPVYRYDKETTQVRVVFDASAHAPGMPSLNDQLCTGENLLPIFWKFY